MRAEVGSSFHSVFLLIFSSQRATYVAENIALAVITTILKNSFPFFPRTRSKLLW